MRPSFTRPIKRQQSRVTPGLGLLALSCHQFAVLAGRADWLTVSFTHRRAAHLPGGCSASAAATQGLPLSNPALSASEDNAIFLQGIPLQSHSRQIHHVTEKHISEIHTPGQCPGRGRSSSLQIGPCLPSHLSSPTSASFSPTTTVFLPLQLH